MVSTGNLWRDTQYPEMPAAVREAHATRRRCVADRPTSIGQTVEISAAVFSSEGLVVVVEHFTGDTLVLQMADGIHGDFERIATASPVFALRRVQPAN